MWNFLKRRLGARRGQGLALPEELSTTASGLRYKAEVEGSGRRPDAASHVTVHYTGWHMDGRVFDSSVERGKPAAFPLGRVIPGWTEGLQLMREGSRYLFVIPPELAYGKAGAPPKIRPNETLVFQVELLHLGG